MHHLSTSNTGLVGKQASSLAKEDPVVCRKKEAVFEFIPIRQTLTSIHNAAL